MKSIVWFCIKSCVLLGLGAYAAASYLSPTAQSESPEQPSKAQVVIDLTKTDGHFNIGIGWRKVEEPVRNNSGLTKEQF